MTISAVIFDLDGTVLSNEDEYGIAFRKVLRSLGKKVDKKYPHTGGIGVEENWPRLLAKYKIITNKTVEELARETQNEYLNLLDRVTFIKGFKDFVADLKQAEIECALATSNAWWIVDKVSEYLDLEGLFTAITTGEEVEHKKPDPNLFLVAAQKLGVKPDQCLVIEDSKAGIEAAHRAGMKAVGIARNDKHAKELKEADIKVRNFYELSPEMIHTL